MGTPAGRHALAAATVAAYTDALLGPYERTWRALTSTLARIRDTFPAEPSAVRRRRAAAFAVQAVALIDQLDAEADTAVADAVRGVVAGAAAATIADLARTLEVRRGVVDAAVRDLLADLKAASSYTLATARALSRAVQRLATVEGTPTEQSAALERALRDRGLTAVVYRDGSRHGLEEYARMATRTKLAETWQLASFDLFRQAGITYVEVVDGAGCFAGDTPMLAYDGLLQVLRSWHVGSAVRLVTAATPQGLTIGSDHPVLTRRGLVPAHELREGDEVVHDLRLWNSMFGSAADLKDVPTVADLFESLAQKLGTRRRPASDRDNLDRDPLRGEGEIEVVRAEGPLLLECDLTLSEEGGEFMLVLPDAGLELMPGHRDALTKVARVLNPSGGVVRSRDLAGALILGELGPLVDGSASYGAEPVDSAALLRLGHDRAAVLAREGHRHYEFTPVVSATSIPFEGWMYDATSVAGLLNLNGIVASNCGWTRHDDPDKANGTIRSIDEAEAYPLAHPHCSRSTFPRVDVVTERDARTAGPLSRLLVPDAGAGDRAPAVRVAAGRLDTQALAVLAPAAARHAQTLARVQARNVGAEGHRAVRVPGVVRATLRTPRGPAPGPGAGP